MKKSGLALLLLLPVVSMAATAPFPIARKATTFEYLIKPQLGQVSTAEVGNPLFKESVKRRVAVHVGKLKQDVDVDMGDGRKLIVKSNIGGPMMMHAVTKKPMLCFYAQNTTFASRLAGSNLIACAIDREGTGVLDAVSYNNSDVYVPISPPAPYDARIENEELDIKDNFHVEVLYQGISKGEIKISYREFMNDMARPAFNQDLSYELNPKGETAIGFKGMRLRVLKADSQSIEYIMDQPIASDLRARVDTANALDEKDKAWK